jgi:hypothetical protein
MNIAADGIVKRALLERDEEGEELDRDFTAVPWPYDEYLNGIGYEAYQSGR